MRKLILTVLSGLITVWGFSQAAIQTQPHDKAVMMEKFKNAKAVQIAPSAKDNGVPLNNESFYAKTGSSRTGDQIGETGYDLQSNSGAMDRVRAYVDGQISAIWTGSTAADGSWADRGMFYAHNDGASWGAMPTARVEAVRTGFGSIITVEDHEVVISHDGVTIVAFANEAIGGGTWTALGISTLHAGLWPRAYCPAGTDDIYVVSANANPPTGITFSRSDDGGATYTVSNYMLPYLDTANCFGALSADAYQIAVDGSTVYILYGTSWTNLVLLTSTSNGDPGTWTSQTLIETGLCNYQGDVDQTSDVTGDGIADTIETTDGFHEMVLDPNGILHVWSGYYWLLDDDVAEGWSYFPGIYGLWYWNSTMAEIAWLDLLVDWDGDGEPFLGIGADLGMYDGVTFTSMANASYDPDNDRIYLMYTHPIEYTDYYGDPTVEEAQSFRDIFGVYSDDLGLSWTSPVNMTYTAHENIESSFPYCYDRVVDGCVHTVWQSDVEPGTSLDVGQVAADPYAMNQIYYKCFDEARFNPYPPVADYEYVPTPGTGLVNFTNLSIDADSYDWAFGDGGTATTKNTSHVYATSGAYNVCLTAHNVYDDDTECKIINVEVSVVDMALQQSINVYPSPASSYFNLEVEGSFGQLFAEVYNTLGERVINSVSLNGTTSQFDVSTLPAGNYIIKVTSENGRYATVQITVNR